MSKKLVAGDNQVNFVEGGMLYFAYGSNLLLKQMQLRCPDHRIIGQGKLTGYRWLITSRGYASIVKSAAAHVLGIVYDLSETDIQALDSYEGVKQGSYYKQQVFVQVNDRDMPCMTYIDPVIEEGVPHQEYITRINHGIQDAGLPEEYIELYLRSFIPVTH